MGTYTDRQVERMQARFLTAFQRGTKGLEAFSVGACPGCSECGLDADSFKLIGASSPTGHKYGRVHDEGSGPLWVVVVPLGILGIVRAEDESTAWECALDCILDDASAEEAIGEDGELAEGLHYRPNGVPTCNGLMSAVCAEDPNGTRLVPLQCDLSRGPAEEATLVFGGSTETVYLDWSPSLESARAEADEGSFSWSDCDACGTSMGGDRYPAHWIYRRSAEGTLPARESIEHEMVCQDCLLFSANGDLPGEWHSSSVDRRATDDEMGGAL